jgi:drug/metabolite transporter (DMT)-like permease
VDVLTSNDASNHRSIKKRGNSTKSLSDSWGNITIESDDSDEVVDRRPSWIDVVDLYGKKKSFSHKRNSYARFLDIDVIDEEENSFLIEETNDVAGVQRRQFWASTFVVPILMLLDLTLGVSLSLYDSNLLRNIPGFHFPLCYAWTQKFTNAVASLVFICLSRKREMAERRRLNIKSVQLFEEEPLTELPSMQVFRVSAVPLSVIAMVQTISAAFANCSLQMIPLPLFKVVLMCGPIFVAFITSVIEGNNYSRGRILALSLIGIGALRAVYAEATGADNPREVMEGAGYALGASALSGMGLVVSGVLMHRESDDDESDVGKQVEELNPLSLLFYLSCEQVIMLSLYLCPWDSLWNLHVLQNASNGSDDEFLAFMIYFRANPQTTMLYLMTGSIIALGLAVITFTLVTRTSPVAASLLGNLRSIGTVAISSLIWGGVGDREAQTNLFGSALLGYTLTLVGGVVYALAPATNRPPK